MSISYTADFENFADAGEHDDSINKKSSKTEWLKVGNVDFLSCLGKDVVAFGKGCYIILYNVSNRSEILYKADRKAQGEGVQCLVGYPSSAYIFAFAELAPSSRIFLVKYPTMEHVTVLQDEPYQLYIALAFAEMELMICLTGIPKYEIVVWCWRTRQKLYAQPTSIVCVHQQIRSSVSLPIGACQLAKFDSSAILFIWDINVCGEICTLNKNELKYGLKPNTYISAFCWSPDGSIQVADTFGNLYVVKEDKHTCVMVLEWPPYPQDPNNISATNMLWWKEGVVVSGPNSYIQFFKRSGRSEWSYGWVLTTTGTLSVMAVNRYRDLLVGWSMKDELVNLKVEPEPDLEVLKYYGSGYRLLELVHPKDEFLATVADISTLAVLEKETGLQVGQINVSTHLIMDMRCHPESPYLAMPCSDGVLQLVSILGGNPQILTEFRLCTEELSVVKFNKSGTLLITASYKKGRIFVVQGTAGTGQKIKVMSHILLNEHIGNMTVITGLQDQKLLVTLRNNCKHIYSGNLLQIISLPKLHLENRIELGTSYSCFLQTTHCLLAVPYVSRQIHIISFDNKMENIKCVKSRPTGHQIRRYHIYGDDAHVITFGWDGLLFVKDSETLNSFAVFNSHHRFTYGIIHAVIDRTCDYVLTLGKEGNLICTKLLAECRHSKISHVYQNESSETPFKRRITHPEVKGSIELTWLELQEQDKLKSETAKAEPEIKVIKQEFLLIKKEVTSLLNKNSQAPPEEQLHILEFDLDSEARENLLHEAKVERENTCKLIEAECKECDILSENIKRNTWDKMQTNTRHIKAMAEDFYVESYGLPPENQNFNEELIYEIERRKLEKEMSKGDYFEPWFPVQEHYSHDDEDLTSMKDISGDIDESEESKNKITYNPFNVSSCSQNFVPITTHHCSQFELSCAFVAKSEVILLEKVCADLQLYFNKHFDKMFQQKEHEMSILKQRNDRLRTILSELRITCKASLNVPPPVDPTWSQEEKTEFVIKTEDSEVPEVPYISPSQQEILDKIKAEEERQRLLLAADNFRELALIEMMDGVLEIRWEDELKKEIPKPTCMLEKEIEDYTENDLRAIKVYEEKCRFLQSERERYRKMLEHEYKKLTSTIEKSLITFDEQLFELFQIKLKVEAAINQEQLKILRIQKMNADRLHNKEKEQQTKKYVQESEHELNIMQETVNQLQEECNQCHNTYETLVARDKMLGKKFKSEFQGSSVSASIVDQLYKVFRRRPKMQPRVVLYPTLLQELSRCVTEYDQNAFLPPEFHDFLHLLEQLDHYSNAAANVEESAWAVMVHARRSKIESELKVKASALELAEAENTLILYTRKLRALKDKFNNSVSELKNVREEKLKINKDIELQLVMKHGLVEISTTGHLSDFEDVLLINHSVIEDINKNVREAGAKKIAAMMAVTNLHRIIKYKEWEFNKMKMECEDLQDEINNIENIKVTHEVKQYLMDLTNPKEADDQEKSTTLIKQTEENYRKTINNLTEEIVATESKTEHYRILSERIDKEILTLKCDLSKQQFERDITFEEKLHEASHMRMAVIVKRSQLVQEIQQNHKDNIILQTELELLRLKTYPTLKIKTIFN